MESSRTDTCPLEQTFSCQGILYCGNCTASWDLDTDHFVAYSKDLIVENLSKRQNETLLFRIQFSLDLGEISNFKAFIPLYGLKFGFILASSLLKENRNCSPAWKQQHRLIVFKDVLCCVT